MLQVAIVLFAVQRDGHDAGPSIDATKFEQPYPPLAQGWIDSRRHRGPLWTERLLGGPLHQ